MQKRVYRQIFLGFAILLPYSNALGLQAPSPTPPNREAIAAVVQELDAAWNAREPARFSAVFSEDGSFGFPVEGIALRGRDEIRGALRQTIPKDAAKPPASNNNREFRNHQSRPRSGGLRSRHPWNRPQDRNHPSASCPLPRVGAGSAQGFGMAHPAGAGVSSRQVSGLRPNKSF